MFKTKTLYTIETTSTLLALYQSDRIYRVQRRFNDFKKLYATLKEVDDYKGFSIPPLPEDATSLTSYMVHSDAFLRERRQKLESFLRLLSAHETIRFDQLFCKFLTYDGDFEETTGSDSRLYGRVRTVLNRLPNVEGLELDLDFFNTFVSFQFHYETQGEGQIIEDEKLKPI